MKNRFKNLRKLFLIGVSIIFFVSHGHPSMAMNRDKESNSSDMLKILWVLENRMGDQKLVEKAKGKISTLSNNQFFLIFSLSARIANDAHKTGTDIAFQLLTALIVLPQSSS